MYTVTNIDHVATHFNSALGLVETKVELTLDNGDKVKETYGFMAVRATDITSGRPYAIIEMVAGASKGTKGIFTLHPTGDTRIGSNPKNARALWDKVVPELNLWLDAQELLALRVRAVVTTIAEVESMLLQ